MRHLTFFFAQHPLPGIEPVNMDGVVLTDALTAPTKAQQHAQDRVANALTAYQRAIMARLQIDQMMQRPFRKD